MTLRWQVRPGAHLHYRSWGGTVVFDEESGHTHLLDDAAKTILDTLSSAERPLTLDELVGKAPANNPLSLDRATTVTSYLARLDLVNLVR